MTNGTETDNRVEDARAAETEPPEETSGDSPSGGRYGPPDPESDPQMVAHEGDLQSEWRRELLLRDHEEAGEAARYRDQLLHSGFYLTLIFTGVLINAGVQFWENRQLPLLAALSSFGAISYCILYVWITTYQRARNGAWNRRRQIEWAVQHHEPDLMKAHTSVFGRLNRRNGEFVYTERSTLEGISLGKVLRQFLLSLCVLSVGVGLYVGYLGFAA